jgi:dethiobiotin synthetase
LRRIIFITGTGTGVGKTVLTALLLAHLRGEGRKALAVKPFCSGSRADARLLHWLQGPDLTLEETNPYFFDRPLAPWVAARQKAVRQIPIARVVRFIKRASQRAEILLVEGSGGIIVPLGDGYAVADLIARTSSQTLVVSSNRLGTINHTLLTIKHLQAIGVKELKIVMMSEKMPDESSESNIGAICELLPGTPVFSLPYLGDRASNVAMVKQNAKKVKKTLAQVLEGGKVCLVPSNGRRRKDCSTIPVDNPALKR